MGLRTVQKTDKADGLIMKPWFTFKTVSQNRTEKCLIGQITLQYTVRFCDRPVQRFFLYSKKKSLLCRQVHEAYQVMTKQVRKRDERIEAEKAKTLLLKNNMWIKLNGDKPPLLSLEEVAEQAKMAASEQWLDPEEAAQVILQVPVDQ